MTAQDFHQVKAVRMLDCPVWFLHIGAGRGDGYPISGDLIATSFSKRPHSPRFPTPPFARVPEPEHQPSDCLNVFCNQCYPYGSRKK